MKYILSLLSLLFLFLTQTSAQPKLTLDKNECDLETILWKKPTKAVFTIKNTGNKPLVISKVTTSCGCTVADWDKQPIMPGKKGIVSAVFDAKTLGRFHKSIGIYSNAYNRPVYVNIKGNVTSDAKNYYLTHPYRIGDVRIDKEEIVFDDANKGEKPEAVLLVANISKKPYYPVLMHLPPYLSAVAKPERLMPDQVGEIKITLDTEKLPKYGLTTSSVYLAKFPGDVVGEDNEIPVSVVLLPDFSNISQQAKNNPPKLSISSEHWNAGHFVGNEKKSYNVIITNKGKSNLEITDLQVFNSALGVSLKNKIIAPGASTKMKVTLFASQLKKIKGSPRVLIITNDPERPKVIFKVNATIKK